MFLNVLECVDGLFDKFEVFMLLHGSGVVRIDAFSGEWIEVDRCECGEYLVNASEASGVVCEVEEAYARGHFD